MFLIFHLIFYLFSNLVALFVASHYVEGFIISPGFENLLLAAVVLTAINALVRPIIKFILSPIIFITLGFGVIIVNALMLYLLDKLLPSITIIGLMPLLYATLIISAVNLVVNFSAKSIGGGKS